MRPFKQRRPAPVRTSGAVVGFGVIPAPRAGDHAWAESAEAMLMDINGAVYDESLHTKHGQLDRTPVDGELRVAVLDPATRAATERARLRGGEHDQAPPGTTKVWVPRAPTQLHKAPKIEVAAKFRKALQGDAVERARKIAKIEAGEAATRHAEKVYQSRVYALPETLKESDQQRTELAMLMTDLCQCDDHDQVEQVFRHAVGDEAVSQLQRLQPVGKSLATTANTKGIVVPWKDCDTGWAIEMQSLIRGEPPAVQRVRAGAQLAGDDMLTRWNETKALVLCHVGQAGQRRSAIDNEALERSAQMRECDRGLARATVGGAPRGRGGRPSWQRGGRRGRRGGRGGRNYRGRRSNQQPTYQCEQCDEYQGQWQNEPQQYHGGANNQPIPN